MDNSKLINQGALQTTCQIVFYLAWCLIDPAAAKAKLFVFKTSNLPPSKEGREGDCGRAKHMGVYEPEASFAEASAFYLRSFLPARPP